MQKRNNVTMLDHTDGLFEIVDIKKKELTPELVFMTGAEGVMENVVKDKKLPAFKKIVKLVVPLKVASELYIDKMKESLTKNGRAYANFFLFYKMPYSNAGLLILASDEDDFPNIDNEITKSANSNALASDSELSMIDNVVKELNLNA